MKKIVLLLVFCSSFLLAINLQTASKEELMNIKGIGERKAKQIIEYRKINNIKSPEDLRNIKGFGDTIVNNVKNNVKVKTKLNKQTPKKAMIIPPSANKTKGLKKEFKGSKDNIKN